jgi:hypothetical protein
MKSLGVCELLRGADPNQTQASILDGLMSKVLAHVDALRTFSASDGVAAPLNAGIVVLIMIDRLGFGSKTHIPQEGLEVDYFNSRIGCWAVLRLCR